MANIRGCKSGNSGDDLLARLKKLIYVIPPVVKEPPLARKKHPLLRFNLPPSRSKKIESRASSFTESPIMETLDFSPLLTDSELGPDISNSEDRPELADDESDPARSLRRGSGPEEPEISSMPCCCCSCLRQRQANREWLLPRLKVLPDETVILSVRPSMFEGFHHELMPPVKAIAEPCVLGVLSCGYVVSGAARLKALGRKQA